MADWTFLTNHARALVCIAHDPGMRLRDIAATLGITERSAYAIVNDLTEAGYVVKDKDGRRNRYRIQADLPLRVPIGREPTIGEVLELLVDTSATSAELPGRNADSDGHAPGSRAATSPSTPASRQKQERRPGSPPKDHHHSGSM